MKQALVSKNVLRSLIASSLIVTMCLQNTAYAQQSTDVQKFAQTKSPRTIYVENLKNERTALINSEAQLGIMIESIRQYETKNSAAKPAVKKLAITAAVATAIAVGVQFATADLELAPKSLHSKIIHGAILGPGLVAAVAVSAMSVVNLFKGNIYEKNNKQQAQQALSEFQTQASVALSSNTVSDTDKIKISQLQRNIEELQSKLDAERISTDGSFGSWAQITSAILGPACLLLASKAPRGAQLNAQAFGFMTTGMSSMLGMWEVATALSDVETKDILAIEKAIGDVQVQLQQRIVIVNAEIEKY